MKAYKDLQEHLIESIEQAEIDKKKGENYWTGYIAALNRVRMEIRKGEVK